MAAVGGVESYAVVGFERDAFRETEIAASLRKRSAVSFCLDSAWLRQVGRPDEFTPEDFTISEDGTYVGIYAFRRADHDDDTFVHQIRDELGKYDPNLNRFALAGPAIFHVSLNAFSQQRLPVIMLLINLMGGAWLWWITGKPWAAVTGVAAIMLSQIVLLGIVSWQRIPVDMSLSMVPPLIMALGYSYAAHRALRRGITGTLLLCCSTTAAGIASVGISDLAPLRMFALYGALGMVLVWLAVVTLLPALSASDWSHRPRDRWLEPLLRCNLAAIKQHDKAIVLVGVALTTASFVAIPNLRFETNPLGYFPSDVRITRDFSTIDARLTGTLPFQVTVTGEADPSEMLRNTAGVKKILNVTDIVRGDDSTYWGLAQNDAMPDLVAAQQTWRDWAEMNHVQLQWRGVAAQINATGKTLRRVAVITLPAMGLIAVMSVGFLTRSIRMACLAAWVNLLPVCGLVLIAAITRISIGLPSLMIGAIAVGMAIDDTIHLVRAFQQRDGITRGLVRCWRPCVGSTLVVASCLTLFAISPFRPTRQFGILLATTAVFAIAIDMLLLPAVARSWRTPGTAGTTPAKKRDDD